MIDGTDAQSSHLRPIEPGVTILRASAGTGKTFQLAHIVLRLVVERDLQMRELAVVTFTKAATKELVDRVRRRLVDAELALTAVLHGEPPRGDEVLRAWAVSVPQPENSRRAVQCALREFDEALISTIHSFCQSLLVQHAFETGATFGLSLDGAGDDLCEEIVDDFLTGTVLAKTDDDLRLAFGNPAKKNLLDIAQAVVGEFSMECLPDSATAEDVEGTERARFAALVRSEYVRRITDRGVVSFSDLSRQLNETFDRTTADDPLLHLMSGRFKAVLVDEFQDTDDQQWNIFQTLFKARPGDLANHYLFLVGDAKQAIYGFRGANIRVYGDACADFDFDWPLNFNYRSDPPLLSALNTLFGSGADAPDYFSDPSIEYTAVQAPDLEPSWSPQLELAESASTRERAPLQLRYFDALAQGLPNNEAPLSKGAAEELISEYVAADITALLKSGATLKGRPLIASDIAILVRSHTQGSQVQSELIQRGVPAAVTAKRSVFMSPLAQCIREWLVALSEPNSPSAARRCAASRLFGWTGRELLALESDPSTQLRWDTWRLQIKAWREQLDHSGFFRTFRTAMTVAGVTERLLRSRDGDRDMTDLLHMVDLIGEAEAEEGLRLPGLIRWMNAPERESGDDDANKIRLERDDASVRIMTVHKSKGLQFPIVYAPFLGVGFQSSSKPRGPFRAPKEENGIARIFDLRSHEEQGAQPGVPGVLEMWARKQREEHRESLRLTYVALTRAKHRLVVYTGHTSFLMISGLGPLLHAGPSNAENRGLSRIDYAMKRCPSERNGLPPAATLRADLSELESASPGHIAVSDCERIDLSHSDYRVEVGDPESLKVRLAQRTAFNREWVRMSYSSLTRDLHGGTSLAETYEDTVTDRGEHDEAGLQQVTRRSPKSPVPLDGPRITLATYPGGPEPGSCLHAIFERIDFVDPESVENREEIERVVTEQLTLFGISKDQYRDEVVTGVIESLLTPLDACKELLGVRLADISHGRRLDELDFLMPVAGGLDFGRTKTQINPATRRALIDVFKTAIGDGPITPAYVESLSQLRYESFAGFLTGSIDLVFAVDGSAGQQRFFVVDYKSNKLNLNQDENPVVQRFNQCWMADEMAYHHYILQYHLYSVALQRFLRSRIPDYTFERHFGGAVYLFIRGMIGPRTPVSEDMHRYGVFFHRPRQAVIDGLDRALSSSNEETCS